MGVGTGAEVVVGVAGIGDGVGVGDEPGVGVEVGTAVGKGMLDAAEGPEIVLGVAVGAGVEDGSVMFETAVGPSNTPGVAEGTSPSICRGSASDCPHADAPIANISKV